MARTPRLSWVCLLTVLAAEGQILRAEKADSLLSPLIHVDVLLTASDTLSPSARAELLRETESIWLRHGVVIRWLPPTDASPPAQYRLRALIVAKRAIPAARGAFAIGELVGSTGSHPVAFVSIEGAQRLVTSSRVSMGYDLVVLEERRLGITLGRALAHEIGHFLLRTNTHARNGLMRSQFDAAEFTDLRDGPVRARSTPPRPGCGHATSTSSRTDIVFPLTVSNRHRPPSSIS